MCENNVYAMSRKTLKVLRDLSLLDAEDEIRNFPRSVCNYFSIYTLL
jgi:hypothetical protein